MTRVFQRHRRLASLLLLPVAAGGTNTAAAAEPPLLRTTLTTADPNQEERFGFAVDVQGDLAVVGAYGDSALGQLFRGSASVFRRDARGIWNLEQKLTAADGAGFDQFGFAVAIVGEGAARGVVVTAPKGPGAQHPDQGCAYAFERMDGAWTQVAKLTLATGANNDAFGYSADGSASAVVVGAVFDDASATNQGSASVFRRAGSGASAVWTLEATLVAPDAAPNDQLGFDVAIEGDAMVAGANADDVAGAVDKGSAWVFRRAKGSWVAEAQLTAAGGTAGDFLGTSVAIGAGGSAGAGAGAGDLVVCGSIFDAPEGQVKRGSATVFRSAGAAWTEGATLVAADSAAGDECGVTVAIGAGGLVLVGGFKHDVQGFADAGRVWAWSVDAVGGAVPAWSLTAPVVAAGDAFGHAIAIDAESLAIGAYATDGLAPNQGALALYAFATPPCAADLDGDASVGPADLAMLLSAWGTAMADLDGDGTTGAPDLAALLGAWGACG
jgi:hypothetical protein